MANTLTDAQTASLNALFPPFKAIVAMPKKKLAQLEKLQQDTRAFAETLVLSTPAGPQQTSALAALRESLVHANTAVVTG